MLKRLLALGAAAAGALVSACGDGPATVSGTWRSPATWGTMVYASGDGPLLVEVHGDPFGRGADFRFQVAAAMDNQIIGRKLAITADRALAPHPDARIVVAFDPPPGFDPRHLCEGRVPTRATVGDRLTVLAAFCQGSETLSSVDGWVAGAAGPDDRRFRQLMGQVARALFGDPQ